MATYKQVSFTTLELKGLMLRAEIGCRTPCPEIDQDQVLAAAAESALDKLHRANLGMGPKGRPGRSVPKPRPEQGLDLRRRSA